MIKWARIANPASGLKIGTSGSLLFAYPDISDFGL
jgi:hypothetical protein